MKFDLDEQISRRGTLSLKWDQGEALFGDADVLPLWVADMDFKCPPAVIEALTKRAKQGIFGYTNRSHEYLDAITNWFKKRHDWNIDPTWLTDSPGVVPSLSISVEALTEPGDEVILQSPVYNPFYNVIVRNGRKLAESPLLFKNGRYEMDYEKLESFMQNGAKLLLLCNPHNPGGRVWAKEELERLGTLCIKYGVKVVSDEIHCDLVFRGNRHTPFASISEQLADITVTCLAPSKTFNIPGLQTSFTVISNPQLRRKFVNRMETLALGDVNFFGPVATIAAYQEGVEWLDAVLEYVHGNVEFTIAYFSEHIPALKPVRPEGTYLLWVDCRALGLSSDEMKQLMYQEAKIAFTEGSIYGTGGEGFLRINLACPRQLLAEALSRFSIATAAKLGS